MVQRTIRQNRAIWLYLTKLSDELNAAGLDMRKVLKQSVLIPWNKDAAHDLLWIPIQKAVLKSERTRDLNKQEVSEIYEVLNRFIGEKFGIHIAWPSHAPDYYDSAPMHKEYGKH